MKEKEEIVKLIWIISFLCSNVNHYSLQLHSLSEI